MLDLNVIGRWSTPVDVSWTARDAMLYALGVGAGQADPTRELEFTTENSRGITQRVLPTFGACLVFNAQSRPLAGQYDPRNALHQDQSLTVYAVLPTQGTLRVTTRVAAIYDQQWGALVVYESRAIDPTNGRLAVRAKSSTFIVGAGSFGGDRAPATQWPPLDRSADIQLTVATRPEQALIYRLSGDRNPLHSDPAFASIYRLKRPILHGLCTFGIVGRALLNATCQSDPERFRSLSTRFSRPVVPGEVLTIRAWLGACCQFDVLDHRGQTVLDTGSFTSS